MNLERISLMSFEDRTSAIEKQHGVKVANLYVQIHKLQQMRKELDTHEGRNELDNSIIKLQCGYENLTGVPYIRA